MRILTGQAKGRALTRPRQIRATAEKVKAALFNILGETVRGARFLDVCAGSGAIGLEAWSRGASAVTWIERDAACAQILRANLARLAGTAPSSALHVLRGDAPAVLRRLGARGAQFDLVFLDPPYDDISLLKKTLQALEHHAILPDTGWLMIEHARRRTVAQLLDNVQVVHEYHYGDTVLALCRRADPAGAVGAAH